MNNISDLPAWERLFKKIVWNQLGDFNGKMVLDFGSGQGITANHYAIGNTVTAVEPWNGMLQDRWNDNEYTQILGDISALSEFENNLFDIIICHNVLEYIEDKKTVINELARVLKPNGLLSIVKHNRAGRIMQMTVLLDDFDKANALLDGKDSEASKFGTIKYYEDEDICHWEKKLKLKKTYGIRTFWDLQQNQDKHSNEDWQNKMMQLEMRVSEMEEFSQIAFFHHLILTK